MSGLEAWVGGCWGLGSAGFSPVVTFWEAGRVPRPAPALQPNHPSVQFRMLAGP